MRIVRSIAAWSMLAMPLVALADDISDNVLRAPEPEMLALVAGAAAAWGIVAWIRRK